MSEITIGRMIHAYTRKHLCSVWLIPGTLADFEKDENEDLYPHITDFLAKRGVLLLENSPPDLTDQYIKQLLDKFSITNITVSVESLCDD